MTGSSKTNGQPSPQTSGPDNDPAVSIVGPGDGETLVLGTARFRILEDGRNTAHRLGLAEAVVAPHTPGPPQHRHAQHDEGFYVISGTVRFTVGQTDYDAPAGTFVMVPPGAPHTFANPTDEPAVMLSTFTPDLYLQYFRDLRDMFAAGPAVSAGVDRDDEPLRHRARHRVPPVAGTPVLHQNAATGCDLGWNILKDRALWPSVRCIGSSSMCWGGWRCWPDRRGRRTRRDQPHPA